MDVLLKLDLAETRELFAAFFALSDFHWQGFLSARLTFPQARLVRRLRLRRTPMLCSTAAHGEPACLPPGSWMCTLCHSASVVRPLTACSQSPACRLPGTSPASADALLHVHAVRLLLTGHCLGRAADRLWPVAVREVQQHGAAEPAAQGPAGAADHAGRPRAHHWLLAQGPAAPPELTLAYEWVRIAECLDGVSGQHFDKNVQGLNLSRRH